MSETNNKKPIPIILDVKVKKPTNSKTASITLDVSSNNVKGKQTNEGKS
jgi:hypothetical protein